MAKDERQWWLDGVEPDQRYSLANERTFLAWIRTALAFVAGAVAVVQLVPPFAVPVARQALAVLLACGGLLIAALAYRRWRANERAMRQQQPLAHTRAVLVVSGLAVLVAVVVVLLVLVEIIAR